MLPLALARPASAQPHRKHRQSNAPVMPSARLHSLTGMGERGGGRWVSAATKHTASRAEERVWSEEPVHSVTGINAILKHYFRKSR